MVSTQSPRIMGFATLRRLLVLVFAFILSLYLVLWSPIFHNTAARVRITLADSVPPLSSVRGAFSAAYPSESYYGAYGETAFDPSKARGGMSLHQRFGDVKWSNYPLDQRDFKEWEYERSLIYKGTGARVQRFLAKAKSGKGVVISVVGGSVSKGRGLKVQSYRVGGRSSASSSPSPSPPSTPSEGEETGAGQFGDNFPVSNDPSITLNLYNPLNLHARVFEYIDQTFPASPSKAASMTDDDEDGGEDDDEEEENPLLSTVEQVEEDSTTQKRSKRLWKPASWFSSRPGGQAGKDYSEYRGSNIFVNGAQGGVGSDYFSGCWKEHVPEDSDLVLVELGINDVRDISVMETYELLLRSLLEMPSRPAIINIQTFTLLFPQLSQASSLHVDVAAYYDTPVISLRDVILPRILNNGPSNEQAVGSVDEVSRPRSKKRVTRRSILDVLERSGLHRKAGQEEGEDAAEDFEPGGSEVKKWFRNVQNAGPSDKKVIGGVDLMHISSNGHALLAEMVIHYLETQRQYVKGAQELEAFWDVEEVGADVPGMLLAGAYSPGRDIRRSNPFCRSTNTAIIERRLQLPIESNGWREWAWGEKNYLISNLPGSIISFPFTILPGSLPSHPDGFVKIGYQKSHVYGLGSVKCWVDEDTDMSVFVDGWWEIQERNMGVITTIRDDLPSGDHTLHCKLLKHTADPHGGHEFRLFAVMHD